MEKIAKIGRECDDGYIYIYRGEALDFARSYFQYDLMVRTMSDSKFESVFESGWDIYDGPDDDTDIDNMPSILRIMSATFALMFRI